MRVDLYNRYRRQVLGRHPELMRWTPSKPLPWKYGFWNEGHRFTQQQEAGLIKRGRDPVTAEAMTVRREADPYEEIHAQENRWLPVYEFLCPIIGKGKAGTIRVLAPNGSACDVHPNGWRTQPKARPYKFSWI